MYLFTFNYWFNTRPNPISGLSESLLAFFIILFIVLTIIAKIKTNKKQIIYSKIWDKIFIFSLTQSIFGVLLFFFNYQMVPILMSRFWFLLWLIMILVWCYILFKQIKKIPERKETIAKEKEFKKYIP